MSLLRRSIDRFGIWVVVFPWLVVAGLLLDRDRSIGGIAWTLLTMYVMYRLGLWFISPYLLPIEDNAEARAWLHAMLVQHAGGRPPAMAIVREGKMLPDPDGKPRKEVKGEGVIFVDSTSVALISTDIEPMRLVGPGVHAIQKDEKIGTTVDLRIQVRSQEVLAQTRDAIWIKFKVTARFRIDKTKLMLQPDQRGRVSQREPYDWSHTSVWLALSHERVGADEDMSTPWDKLALTEAINRVRTHVAQYTFDELTEPQNPLIDRRDGIGKVLEKEVADALSGKGIKIVGITLGQFVPRDPEVIKQRLESWKAEWGRRMRIIEAQGLAERYRLIETARAHGQMEMIMRIAQAIEASPQIGFENAEEMALRLLDVVERLAAEPDIEGRLSSESREALDAAHRKLLEKGSNGGE
jgi:hypothetical protein